MIITVLRAKIHRCVVSGSELHYEGSIAIDTNLLRASGILINEKVDIYNVSNGERFSTYAIPAPAGSGDIVVNGAAARKVQKGDHLIICAYGSLELQQAPKHVPIIVMLDDDNRIIEVKGSKNAVE